MFQNEGRQDWWRAGRDFPMIFQKSQTDHWELMVSDFWTVIAAKNASILGDFRAARKWSRNGPGNEASLAAIRFQNEGRQDRRRVSRDFPRISQESRTDRWGLTVPDFWALITAANAPFFGDFRVARKWSRNGSENEEYLAAIRA